MGLIAQRGTDAVPIRDLAEAAGVSERTFYRFFPRKEDCLRPVLQDARAMFHLVLEQEAPQGWRTAVSRAFRAAVGGAFHERTVRLMPVIARSPELESVWQHETRRGWVSTLDVFAPELTAEQRLPLLHAVGALMQLALEGAATTGTDPVTRFERDLALVTATLAADAAERPTEEEQHPCTH